MLNLAPCNDWYLLKMRLDISVTFSTKGIAAEISDMFALIEI